MILIILDVRHVQRNSQFKFRFILPLDININNDTIFYMAKTDEIISKMKQNPRGIRFSDLCKACDHFFGAPGKSASSHRVYKTPWQGDPRINIQNYKGKARSSQVKQVLLALDKLEVNHGIKK